MVLVEASHSSAELVSTPRTPIPGFMDLEDFGLWQN